MGITALVMGSTGLVGRHVTQQLLSRPDVDEVRILVRRPVEDRHPKLAVIAADWDRLEQHKPAFGGADCVFSCLGTTRKKAGSQDAFRKVDYSYVLNGAKLAKESGVPQFLAVSSMGADASSRNFYLRVKGETEEGLSALAFPGLHIFRPSLLLGEREERRLGEGLASVVMKRLDFAFRGKLAPYRAVPGDKAARAMVSIALAGTKGYHVYSNEVIHALGEQAGL